MRCLERFCKRSEKAEIGRARLQRKKFEIRNRVGVDQNAGKHENRAERQVIVNSKERQSDVCQRLQNAGDADCPKNRADLLTLLRAAIFAVFGE